MSYNKFEGLTPKETSAIREFGELLLNSFPKRIKKLILFGSKARRTANRTSDIDLLVVLTKNGKSVSQKIAALTHGPIAKYMVDISPIVVDENFFKQWSPLLEHINKDGITIWTNKKAGKNM